MAAPEGNQFWKLRSKHGRDVIFSNAEYLWESACEYFEWADNNPWLKQEQRKGNIILPKELSAKDLADIKEFLNPVVSLPTVRPYTIKELCVYLGVGSAWFRQFRDSETGKTEDFSSVITRIEEIIYSQKFSGAAVGAFNANIIARDLGLKEQSETSHTHKFGIDAEEEYVD